MMRFIYNPFHGHDDDVLTRDKNLYQKKYGQEMAVAIDSNVDQSGHFIDRTLRSFLFRPLRVVKRDDVVIINAHGSNTAVVVGAQYVLPDQAALVFKARSPAGMAAQMQRDGLSKRHIRIKLISCYSGGNYMESNTAFLAEQPFAQCLARELGQRGYNDILVAGYGGAIKFSSNAFNVPLAKKYDPSQKPTKGTRITFNARGEQVGGPELVDL